MSERKQFEEGDNGRVMENGEVLARANGQLAARIFVDRLNSLADRLAELTDLSQAGEAELLAECTQFRSRLAEVERLSEDRRQAVDKLLGWIGMVDFENYGPNHEDMNEWSNLALKLTTHPAEPKTEDVR